MKRFARISPLTVTLAAVLLAGIALAATPALRLNGLQFGANDTTAYVTAYGCKGDGSTDNTSCIQSAINAVNAAHGSSQGGTVYFPAGTYVVASPISLASMKNIRLRGESGDGASPNPSSTIIYSGTGSSSFLQAGFARNVTIDNLGILYSSGSFTGILVDFSVATGNTGGTGNHINHCTLSSSVQASVWSAASLVSFSNSYSDSVTNSTLSFAQVGITLSATNADSSNAHLIDRNQFSNFQTAGILNAGNKTTISNNTFEPNGAIGSPSTTMYPTYLDNRTIVSGSCLNLNFVNNWLGDSDNSKFIFDSGSSTNKCYGLTFVGNEVSSASARIGNTIGGNISNNYFDHNLAFVSGGTYVGVEVSNNTWGGAGPGYTNLPTSVSLYGNNIISATSSGGADDVMFDRIDTPKAERLQLGGASPNLTGIDSQGLIAYIGSASTVPSSPWISPTLLNSWVNFGSGNSTAGYYKDALGQVHLKGDVKSGSAANAIIFTLPAGYRPIENRQFIGNANGVGGQLTITSTGNVSYTFGGSTTYEMLDGITFLAEQ